MSLSISRTLPVLVAILALAACGRSDRAQSMAEREAKNQPHEASVTVPPAAAIPSAADFVAKASASDLFEVQSGQAAQDRAANPLVKAFAANLVRDHTKSSQELKKALALLQAYAQDGDVPSLKAFAAEAAGVVQHHLKDARQLVEQVD